MRLFDLGWRGEERQVHDRVLTVPNAITATRLAGLPVFAWLVLGADEPAWGLALLVVIAATDWVDGFVARRFDQVSRLGALVDPLTDRLLVATVGLTLLIAQILPWPLLAAALLRDALLLGGALLLFGGMPPVAVSRTGKTATALLLVALPALLLAEVLGSGSLRWLSLVLMTVGVGAYYGAGVQYARVALALRREGRA